MSLNKLIILNHKTDTVDTPPAGKVFLWVTSGNSVKIKTSTGDEFTLATGVTPEDVQDIIGTFIQSQNDRVTLVYNDASNILELTLVEGNIVHQNISGSGANTHAQIDAHISNTSNPHGTTAGQVGAYTTAQTNTLLLGKYDATNPSGYETPAQLDSRDTANRSRANHTGTQLASSISDFLVAVVGSVLSGFIVGADLAVLATDTVLQAFGKIQGQINAIKAVLSTLVIGDNFEQFLDNTSFSTTSAANQVAASFATTSKAAGLYRIAMNWRWTSSTGTADTIFGLYVDGVLQDAEHNMELQDPTTFQWFYQMSYINLTAGVHTIELRARNEVGGNTLTVSHVRAEMWRAN